jgi:C-terminal processing protease CtpA/Prc
MIDWILVAMLQGGITNSPDVGIVGIRLNASHTITHVYSDGPAEAVGLKKGDRFVAVGSKKWDELMGLPGTSVTVKVKRGKEILEFTLVRKDVLEFHNPELERKHLR